MKKIICTLTSILLYTSILFAQYVSPTPPIIADHLLSFWPYTEPFIPPANVLHTGAASCWYLGQELRVSVWDGTEASFNWNYGGAQGTIRLDAATLGSVSDPDIVVTSELGPMARIMIFSIVNGEVRGEAWEFFLVGGVPTISLAIPAGALLMSNGDCTSSNPNIDIIPNCGLALVWEECGKIWSRNYGFGTGSGECVFGAHPIIEVSPCVAGMKSEPDVSVFRDGDDNMANFVFINNTGVEEQLVIQQHRISDLSSAIPVNCAEMIVRKSVPSATEELEFPRVASPPNDIAMFDPRDCEIVVRHISNLTPPLEQIIGYTHREMTYGAGVYQENILNEDPDLRMCGHNAFPVVSYTDCNQITVEWEYRGQCLYSGPSFNIIARTLDLDGIEIWPDYTAITEIMVDQMRYPSVCGRYLLGSSTNRMSLFHFEGQTEMGYTFSSCAGPLARKKNINELETSIEHQFSFYPNPTNSILNIELSTEDNQATNLRVVDMKGQEIFNEKTYQNKYALRTEFLAEGVYFLIVSNKDGVSTEKFVVKH